MKAHLRQWIYFAAGLAITNIATASVKIKKIEFLGTAEFPQITVTGSAPFHGRILEGATPDQLSIEIPDASFETKNATRSLDTASFSGKIKLISPYEKKDNGSIRIVVQASEPFTLKPKAVGNKLYLGVDHDPDPDLVATRRSSTSTQRGVVSEAEAVKIMGSDQSQDLQLGGLNVPEPGSDAARMDDFLEAQKSKNFKGRAITLQVKDADLVDVLSLIGETSGFNIVAGSDVSGKVNLSLVNVPWDLALDTVLTTNKLGAERNQNILRIALLANLASEKVAEAQAKRAIESNAPRVTRIFPVSYAKPVDLVKVLQKFGTGSGGADAGGGSGGAGVTSASILVDERTNAIVIQETADNLNRMAKLIELLDKPTPQILIEAKIVEAGETLSNSLSGNLGGGVLNSVNPFFNSNSGTWADPLLSVPGLSTAAGLPNNNVGANMTIRPLGRLRLNALLSFNEAEEKSKIIASPRLTVLNRQKANITQGTPVAIAQTTINPTTGTLIQLTTLVQAELNLSVTPTVTNDGQIIMELTISNDVPELTSDSQNGISRRNMTSTIVTESGSTLAIGGIYSYNQSEAEGGFPFLRKIPFIGALFGFKNSKKTRRELFVFITPKILNEEIETKDNPTASSSSPSPNTKF